MMGQQTNTIVRKTKSLTARVNKYNPTRVSEAVKNLPQSQPKPLSRRDIHRQEVAMKKKI